MFIFAGSDIHIVNCNQTQPFTWSII